MRPAASMPLFVAASVSGALPQWQATAVLSLLQCCRCCGAVTAGAIVARWRRTCRSTLGRHTSDFGTSSSPSACQCQSRQSLRPRTPPSCAQSRRRCRTRSCIPRRAGLSTQHSSRRRPSRSPRWPPSHYPPSQATPSRAPCPRRGGQGSAPPRPSPRRVPDESLSRRSPAGAPCAGRRRRGEDG